MREVGVERGGGVGVDRAGHGPLALGDITQRAVAPVVAIVGDVQAADLGDPQADFE